jgi:quercetin dioxygenase-like cupin family protein
MAIRGNEIRNPKTGQRIKFLQTTNDTKGSFLEMISTYEAKSIEPPSHYHPYQEEYFEIVSGELTVRINGEIEVLGPGHQLHIAKGTSHAMWNNTNKPTTVRWKVVPALETERFLETITGLANQGKTGPDGRPGFLQVALTVNRFDRVFRLARLPYALQKVLFTLLTPIAYVCGCKPEVDVPVAD